MNPALVVTVIVAVIAVTGSFSVALVQRRRPVSVQDLWAENRLLRADVVAQEKRLTDLEKRYDDRDHDRQRTISILATALDMLWHHVELLRDEWGNHPMPELSPEEDATLRAAREIRPPIIGAS